MIIAFLGIFVYGLLAALPGSVLPTLERNQFLPGDSAVGTFLLINAVGAVLAYAVSGPIIDRIGTKGGAAGWFRLCNWFDDRIRVDSNESASDLRPDFDLRLFSGARIWRQRDRGFGACSCRRSCRHLAKLGIESSGHLLWSRSRFPSTRSTSTSTARWTRTDLLVVGCFNSSPATSNCDLALPCTDPITFIGSGEAGSLFSNPSFLLAGTGTVHVRRR